MRQIYVLQDYVPSYRLPFFDQLEAALSSCGVAMTVVVASQSNSLGVAYDDSGRDRPWLETSRFRMSSRTPACRSFRRRGDGLGFSDLEHADLVVTGLLGSSLVSNLLILRRLLRIGPRVAVWGHIGSYVAPMNVLDVLIETCQMRAADAVFAYTRGGARTAVSRGIDTRKIFVLNNTTAELGKAMPQEQARTYLRSRVPIDSDALTWVCFIGALAPEKRVDFLADVLEVLWARGSSIRLVVGGAGTEAGLLDQGVERGQVVRLGRVSDDDKRALASTARLIVCPGRVGLLAVDALRMGVPIVTLSSSMHAPEIEYLSESSSVHFCEEDSVEAYAAMLEALVEQSDDIEVVDTAPSLENMVEQFVEGVMFTLDN